MPLSLLDTDILSEVLKQRDATVVQQAAAYLAEHGQFAFSGLTRYEVLRGLKDKQARAQLQRFEVGHSTRTRPRTRHGQYEPLLVDSGYRAARLAAAMSSPAAGACRAAAAVWYTHRVPPEVCHRQNEMIGPSPLAIGWYGERQTLWHVVDATASDAEQPAVIRTFSSRTALGEDVRRFVEGVS